MEQTKYLNEGNERRVRRITSTSKYVAAVSLTILVFLIGFLVGNNVANSKLGEVEISQQELFSQLTGLELREKLVSGKDVCILSLEDILKERTLMGKRLQALEVRLGKEDQGVIQQKEICQLIELRTLLLLESIQEKCNRNYFNALFFYTNDEKSLSGNRQQSEDLGFVLTTFVNAHKDSNINVFPFDVNTDNPALNALREEENITSTPTLIINKKKYEGFRTYGQLENLFITFNQSN